MKKKGSGIADFFSIIALALILLSYYFLLKWTISYTKFEIPTYSKNLEDQSSLMGILKTPVNVDGKELDISQLISIYYNDNSKKNLVEQEIHKILEQSFDTSKCQILCINDKEIRGEGCQGSHTSSCDKNIVVIPGYELKDIPLSFESDVKKQEAVFIP